MEKVLNELISESGLEDVPDKLEYVRRKTNQYRRHNEVTSQDWKKDADQTFNKNKLLSFQKMKYEWNMQHFCEVDDMSKMEQEDNIQFAKRYNLCMPISNFNLKPVKKTTEESYKDTRQMFKKLGLGTVIYFRQLKTLVCMFFLFSLISLPAYILYYYGGSSDN